MTRRRSGAKRSVSRKPRLYVPELPPHSQATDRQLVTLAPAASAHLAQVLRARPGDEVAVFDGRGSEYVAHVQAPDRRSCKLRLSHLLRSGAPPKGRLHLLQAAIKSGLEGVIQQATELGATNITIFRAERSAPASLSQDRAVRIATGATEQSGRLFLPTVTSVDSFDAAIERATGERLIALPDAAALSAASDCGSATIAIGPEGGFTVSEVEHAVSANFHPFGLGPLTLRAATAGPAALASWQQMRAWRGTST